MNIWDFWANKYNKLWVQKYSLRPTRDYILKVMEKELNREEKLKVLDLGCGPGELIEELLSQNPNLNITGLDFSEGMLSISKERNPLAYHIKMDVSQLNNLDDSFNIIISTHSFPYYKNPEKVMRDLNNLLQDDGTLHMGFASGDSLYDKIALFFVKFTTGPANYPCDNDFRNLIKGLFEVEKLQIIKKRKFMPRIAIYTLKKVKK